MCGIQSLLSLILFQSHVQKRVCMQSFMIYVHCIDCFSVQVYLSLNQVSVCLSYFAVLRLVTEISKYNILPLQHWLAEGAVVKFIGDSVNKT